MPPRTFATVDKILEYTPAAGNVLQEVAGATQIPFLERICTFTSTIIPMVQVCQMNFTSNMPPKASFCLTEHQVSNLRIVECIHHLLCVLRSLSIRSEDIQSPQMLHQIAQVAVTLQKVDSCLRAQQELEQSVSFDFSDLAQFIEFQYSMGEKITMCGAERPSKVQWTHPFLHPLSPLTPSAAYQTFIEIADEMHDLLEVDKLLELTDNIPLAVHLVANIVASEDGISETDLVQSKLPIPEILKCKTTLVRTSLAYVDHAGRLKVLAPIRDYIRTAKPPAPDFVRPLQKHLNDLLRLWKTVMDSSSDLGETIQAIISLNQLNLLMNRGLSPLMQHLHEMLSQIDDHRVHGQFIVEAFRARWFYAIPNPDKYMDEAIEHFRIVNDIEGEARLYTMVARYYADNVHDHKKAQELYQHALTLASQCNSHLVQVGGLIGLAIIESLHGTWSEGLHLSRKAQKIALAAGNLRGELNSLQCQTRCYMGLGDFKRGIQVVNECKALVLRAGIQGGESEFILMNFEAEVYHLKTEYPEACAIPRGGSMDAVSYNLQNALNIFQRVQYPRGILLCEVHAVDLKFREGNTTGLADSIHPVHADSEVSKWAVIFLAFVMRPRERSILPVHQALQRLGDVFAQQSNTEEALSILTVTLEGFTWMDVHWNRAECMQTIGNVHFRIGDLSAASTFWMAARPLFECSLQAQAVMEIDTRLVEVERHHEANLEQLSKLAVPTEPLQQLSIQAEVLVHRDKDPDVNTNKIGVEGAPV
ncbi:hypothetical protein B0H14DRAFT_3173785 [Mycena olivaceomarginata]|nr:hypothetical protein B0H14DRAFT_3173785 [Mycena olivaceomarginata]